MFNLFDKLSHHLTPLMVAVIKRRAESVRMHLANGADPNVRAENGSTALHIAASMGNFDAVQLLLKFGANPSLSLNSGSGATPPELAHAAGHEAVSKLFQEHNKTIQQSNYRPHLFKPSVGRVRRPKPEDKTSTFKL